MSDNNAPQMKYDVFVNFRGQDIRNGLLSHLVEAFKRNQINAFVDDQLEKGAAIWQSLVEANKGSSISLIIFSPDYASSRWCLDELVTILQCKETYRQIVIPVFYKVEPKTVRHQLEGYKRSFADHRIKHKTNIVKRWRHALMESAKLSGIESSDFQNDAKLLKEIVNLVMMRLIKPSSNSKGLVGIEEKIVDVELLIRKEPKDTRLIGIWGMGGMGKTVLAEALFSKLRSTYDGCYFLANQREQLSKHGIISLKKEMFSELLGNVVKIDTPNSLPEDIVRRIVHLKVLIVLDDVNGLDHVEKLLGDIDNFGPGSRIIITTRDKQVLKTNKVNETYQVKELSSNKALELFNLNAFNQIDLRLEFNELSKRVVAYAKGIPLIVKVLAGLLCGKNKEVWESELDKLTKMPPTEVYDVMKLSYDGLDRKERQIFLDLACFFLKSHITLNVGTLNSLLKDNESDNSVIVGLERLKDKAPITISEDKFVSMHDSLQEMAWEIVRQESSKPGSSSWLWDPNDDIYEALKKDKGIDTIRSIRIHLPTTRKQKLIPHIFAKMSILQFMEIYVENNDDLFNQLYIPAEGLQFLATELRFLCWFGYPLKSLPKNFSAEKLVILKLPNSEIEKLWDGVKNLVNLKELDLTESKKLRKLPDLSKATNLEVLLLKGCSMLTSVHSYIFSLPKLEKLELLDCNSLTILTSNSHLCNLSYLGLDFCKLLHLDLSNCHKLQTIPKLPGSLKTLQVIKCKSLQILVELPPFLKTLNARDCESLETVWFSNFSSEAVEQLRENSWKRVLFWNCLNLDQHSLSAISLNAQINAMKFANQHLSKLSHDHVESYIDYDVKYGSYQATYVYPGSNVPEWLEYTTTGDCIDISLPSASPSPLVCFIFCFVIRSYQPTGIVGKLKVNITISDDEDRGGSTKEMHIDYYSNWPIEPDHVCVMYDQRCSEFLNSIAKNQTRLKMRAGIRFSNDALSPELLKGFGISPISS